MHQLRRLQLLHGREEGVPGRDARRSRGDEGRSAREPTTRRRSTSIAGCRRDRPMPFRCPRGESRSHGDRHRHEPGEIANSVIPDVELTLTEEQRESPAPPTRLKIVLLVRASSLTSDPSRGPAGASRSHGERVRRGYHRQDQSEDETVPERSHRRGGSKRDRPGSSASRCSHPRCAPATSRERGPAGSVQRRHEQSLAVLQLMVWAIGSRRRTHDRPGLDARGPDREQGQQVGESRTKARGEKRASVMVAPNSLRSRGAGNEQRHRQGREPRPREPPALPGGRRGDAGRARSARWRPTIAARLNTFGAERTTADPDGGCVLP